MVYSAPVKAFLLLGEAVPKCRQFHLCRYTFIKEKGIVNLFRSALLKKKPFLVEQDK